MSGLFRQKRSDTSIATVELEYGLNLNARSDMMLGSLLRERGFDSLSQLVRACRGQLSNHAAPRSVFLSFHQEDLRQVAGLRLMMHNRRLDLAISDEPNRDPVDSKRSTYIKRALRERIRRVDVVMCLIGNATAGRTWVDWELETAFEERRGICGVRLKGSRGRTPRLLKEVGAPVSQWNLPSMIAAIECAAAVRS
jgi:hypothetical protein